MRWVEGREEGREGGRGREEKEWEWEREEEGDRERKRGIQTLFCGVLSQDQYLQMELLKMSCDNDNGKMQQLMKMFAVSQVAWAEICRQGGQGGHEFSFSINLVM